MASCDGAQTEEGAPLSGGADPALRKLPPEYLRLDRIATGALQGGWEEVSELSSRRLAQANLGLRRWMYPLVPSFAFAGRGEYRAGMQGRIVISTSYPSVYTAAEELGVDEKRAKRLARVMDAITPSGPGCRRRSPRTGRR